MSLPVCTCRLSARQQGIPLRRLRHQQAFATQTNAASSAASSSTANGSPAPPGAPRKVNSVPRRKTIDYTIAGGAALAIGALGYYQYRRFSSSTTDAIPNLHIDKPTGADSKTTFTIPVPGQSSGSGRPANRTLEMLSPEQAESRLREHEESYSLNRPNNCVTRFDIATLASNSPIEDDHCTQILARDAKTGVQGDMLLFGVFDGHAGGFVAFHPQVDLELGWHTSRLISEKLVQYVARELNNVFHGTEEYQSLRLGTMTDQTNMVDESAKLGLFARLLKAGGITRDNAGQLKFADLDADPSIVAYAIKKAFTKLDDDICQAPVNELVKLKGLQGKPVPEESTAKLLPALSGSCALLSYIDTARNKIHVACTGDSRAVMGTWDPIAKKWKVDVLTEDQTGRNLKEVARMQGEHPLEEKDRVIMRGRVLGGLEPTRAFGLVPFRVVDVPLSFCSDAVYKWSQKTYSDLMTGFRPESPRRYSANSKTPPYVTVEPEITVRDLVPESDASLVVKTSGDEAAPEPSRRFMVLATDGLYDRLENDSMWVSFNIRYPH